MIINCRTYLPWYSCRKGILICWTSR